MTTTEPDGLTPELEALMGLYLLHGRLIAHVEGLALSAPISKQERQVIIRLFRPRRIGDLAREIGALPSSMTSLADGLCAKGLLARTKDPADGRAHLIALSAQGEAIRARLTAEAATAFQTQAGLTVGEARTLTEIMRKVRAHISATPSDKDTTSCH
jgi:DNA-binding MarR family transcriptional regulator